MTRYAISIDLDRCIGCEACVVACKAGNERPLGGNYIEVRDIVRGTFPALTGSFAHHRCFHCADAACVVVCPTGALSKRDGLTVVEQDKCSGCGYCVDACPFDVPRLVDNRVSKCTACYDLVQEGAEPWCAQTCPSQAIQLGERAQLLADAQAKVGALRARYRNAQIYGENLLGGLGTILILLDQPAVYGLPENPEPALPLQLWQQAVQPVTVGLAGLSLLTTGLAFIIARREHLREKAVHLAATKAEAHMPATKAQAADQAQPTEPEQAVPAQEEKVEPPSVELGQDSPAPAAKVEPPPDNAEEEKSDGS